MLPKTWARAIEKYEMQNRVKPIVADSSLVSGQQQTNMLVQLPANRETFEINGCKHQPRICGTEAACRSFPNNTSKCVCPHDLSPPTSDLKCPNRVIGKKASLKMLYFVHRVENNDARQRRIHICGLTA